MSVFDRAVVFIFVASVGASGGGCAGRAVSAGPRSAASERVGLAALVKRQPGRADAWRDLGWSDLLDGDRAGAEDELKQAERLAPGDARTQMGLATIDDQLGRYGAARERWMGIVERASRTGTAGDAWAPIAVETALSNLRALVGEVAGEAALRQRLDGPDIGGGEALGEESRVRLLGLRAALARAHGDEAGARRLEEEQGCPPEIVTAGPYGHLPRLDLLRLDAAHLGEDSGAVTAGVTADDKRPRAEDPVRRVVRSHVARSRACGFEIVTPLGEPGVGSATVWAKAAAPGTSTAAVSVDSDQPWRLVVDGQTRFVSAVRDRYPARLRTIDLPLTQGWHRVMLLVATPGPRTELGLRIHGAGVTLSAVAPSAPGMDATRRANSTTGEARPHLLPSLPGGAASARSSSVETRLADYLGLLRAFREGDADGGESYVDKLAAHSPKFVAGLLASARVALDDPSRAARFTRDRARRMFEKALALDERATRARYALAVMDIQDDKADRALELLADWHPEAQEPRGAPSTNAPPPNPASPVSAASLVSARQPVSGRQRETAKIPADGWRMSMARYQALRSRGWQVEAEQALGQAREANPEACLPMEAAVAVAREHRDFARARKAATELARCAPDSEDLALLLREAGDAKAAVAEYRRLLALTPGRETLRASLAEALLEAGQPAEAAPILRELVADQPRSALLRRELADALVASSDDAGAKQALLEGLPWAPESEELRRALHGLGEPNPIDAFRVDGKQVIADFERSGRAYESPAVIVLDRTVTRVFSTGSRLTLTHNIVRVQNKDGIDKWGEVNIPEGADVLVLRTVKADGTTREPEQIAAKKSVSAPDLAPGDYVEFEYLDPSPSAGAFPRGYYAERFFFQSFDAPLDRTEYVLAAPEDMPLQLDRRGGAPEPVVEHRAGLAVRTFRDRHKAQLVPEPGQSPFSEYVPSVRAGSAASFAAWRDYLDDLQFASLRANPELRELAEKLRVAPGKPGAGDDKNTLATAQAIDAWVRRNIKHGGALDEPATSILARGEGNRVTLERALLAAAGVPAEFWLARPRTSAILDGPLPDIEGYDEPLLAVPLGRASTGTGTGTGSATAPAALPASGEARPGRQAARWVVRWVVIDPRFRHGPLGFMVPLLRQSAAFSLEGDGAPRFVTLPGPLDGDADRPPLAAGADVNARANDDLREVTLEAQLDADGGAEVTVREHLTGVFALEWREGLDRIDEDRVRAEFEQRTLGFYFPGASLSSLKFDGRDDDDAPLLVEYRFHAPRFAFVDGKRLVVPAPFPALLGKRYVGMAHRTTPLQLVYTAPQRIDAVIRLPAGATATTGAPVDVKAHGRFTQTAAVEEGGRVLRIKASAALLPDRVPPDKYDELVRQAYAVDTAQARAATVQLP